MNQKSVANRSVVTANAEDEIADDRRHRNSDLDALQSFKARQHEKPPMAEVQLRHLTLEENSSIAHAGNALKSADTTFVLGLMQQLKHLTSADQNFPIDRLNFALSAINSIEPRDPTEALLASQMVAIHNAAMECARRMAAATSPQRIDAEIAAMTKLTRTFAAQLEALKRWRAPSEQSIRVLHQHQHVTVKDGAQAIVGPVSAGAGALLPKERQSHGFK